MRRLKLVFEQLTDTSPIEPQEYLGMHREQIEGVLTAKQIYKEQGKKEVEDWVSLIKEGEMRLSSDLDYTYLTPYIHLAIQYHIPYLLVDHDESETNVGLVVAHSRPVDKRSIWLQEENQLS
ncbi:DUF1694 domain-containing protein [Bacillus thermotolerans]|uniref:DUF1694 domain-containing protein n=1 Tax=Bacillus thermotolerans TaxID=1221996 RepID=UPI00057CE0DF|nr:DUF1694 domain-containing protein [Bacillus thermotolerans]KKB37208.1 hypothetical protein QY97_00373 [Bacillus thermotolerans]